MTSVREAVAMLRDEFVDNLVISAASDIDTVAHVLGIDPHYLSVQVRLHIPLFQREELEHKGLDVIRRILGNLRRNLEHYGVYYDTIADLNGIRSIAPGTQLIDNDGSLQAKLSDAIVGNFEWRTVPQQFGGTVQERMHYIHLYREDTFLHAGLFLDDFIAPICYASFSVCDRPYLSTALSQFLKRESIPPDRTAVMTRAFGFTPMPKNGMSKLFDRSCKHLTKDGYIYVLTALNPFLGFNGTIFAGSSFVPFATSPMPYRYDTTGHYRTRRSSEVGIVQKYNTPPILWLARGLSRKAQRDLEAAKGAMYNITSEEYHAR